MTNIKIVIREDACGYLLYVNGVLLLRTRSVGDEELVASFNVPSEKLEDAIKTLGAEKPLHKAVVRWGSEMTRTDNEGVSSTYNFETNAEREAFMYGVEEAIGWSDYELVEDEGSVTDGK